MSNLFTEEQYDYFYSDNSFVVFLNEYFTSVDITKQSVNVDLNHEQTFEDIFMYIRIVCANMDTLVQELHLLSQNLSYSFKKEYKIYQGMIKGKLLIDHYVKELAKHEKPRNYKCSVKKKTYSTIENVYILFILYDVIQLLRDFLKVINEIAFENKDKSKEIMVIGNYIKCLHEFINKPMFNECREDARRMYYSLDGNFPADELEMIRKRIRTGKIRNSQAYQNIISWIDKYKNNSICFIDVPTMEMFRYSEQFSDKLFELWTLYNIKNTFVNDFGCEVIEYNNVMDNLKGYIYKLQVITGGTLEIYFQKSADIYWDNEHSTIWKYIENGNRILLKGIPDISIKYSTIRDSLVMIDVKNRNRKKRQNSDEIYKMIGYFDNFKNVFQYKYSNDVKKQAALIFRNDYKEFVEDVESEDGYRIKNISVSPCDDKNLNGNQFKLLCKYILDMQGMDGTTSEVVGSYVKNTKDIVENALFEGQEEDVIAYRVSEQNHMVIENLFKTPELKDSLEKCLNKIEKNHFPHIWNDMHDKNKKILAMAECLFDGVEECEDADYSPICLEYCRALEVQMNEQIITPFRNLHNISTLAGRNRYYQKMLEGRDMTLGECLFFFEKLNHTRFPLVELRNYMSTNIKEYNELISDGVRIMKKINETVRRKAAHTSVMDYSELVVTRQMILGIGNKNLFYMMLDKR